MKLTEEQILELASAFDHSGTDCETCQFKDYCEKFCAENKDVYCEDVIVSILTEVQK